MLGPAAPTPEEGKESPPEVGVETCVEDGVNGAVGVGQVGGRVHNGVVP